MHQRSDPWGAAMMLPTQGNASDTGPLSLKASALEPSAAATGRCSLAAITPVNSPGIAATRSKDTRKSDHKKAESEAQRWTIE